MEGNASVSLSKEDDGQKILPSLEEQNKKGNISNKANKNKSKQMMSELGEEREDGIRQCQHIEVVYTSNPSKLPARKSRVSQFQPNSSETNDD